MDLRFTDEDTAFRAEVRDWLVGHIPCDPRPEDPAGQREWDTAWQARQFDGGYGGIAWPVEYGGRGLPLLRQLIWYEEYARAGAPDVGCCFVGNNHAGPTLIARGGEAQKAARLPGIIRGGEVWCQGFSEPGAGSDLAGLSTRAEVDGDELVVTGSKIWTSYADVADWQELLVRTNPDAPKHRGITWVICDMHAPGIDVRPLRMLQGEQEFCQVHYDEVRIPLDNVVGGVDNGWSVAMSTLGFERGTGFMQSQTELAQAVERLLVLAGTRPGPLGGAPALRDEGIAAQLAELRADVAAMGAMTYVTVSRAARTGVPGPEGSMIKLLYGDLTQRVFRFAMDLFGPDSLEIDPGGSRVSWVKRYLRSYAATIGGGTSEVQRDIVGERVLGLPKGRG